MSGEADGVTLSQCLADGRVPVPDGDEDHGESSELRRGAAESEAMPLLWSL